MIPDPREFLHSLDPTPDASEYPCVGTPFVSLEELDREAYRQFAMHEAVHKRVRILNDSFLARVLVTCQRFLGGIVPAPTESCVGRDETALKAVKNLADNLPDESAGIRLWRIIHLAEAE